MREFKGSQRAVITTQGLTKQFGDHRAVDGLDLWVPEGVVYGFLGPNGSGKSTTMKMLLGLSRPTAGEITLLDRKMAPDNRQEILRQVGSMIESPPGYGHLTGLENMQIVARMLGLSAAEIDRALTTVRLRDQGKKLVRNYSLGMKQRLGIAMALARSPKLLVLDEPTNGLDPAGIEEIRELLVALAKEGVTVMVSSHLLDEIDKMATVLGIIANGRLIFQGSKAELFHHSTPDFIIETPRPEAVVALGLPGTRRSQDTVAMSGLSKEQGAEVLRRLVEQGVPVYSAQRAIQNLESVFMDLTGRGGLV